MNLFRYLVGLLAVATGLGALGLAGRRARRPRRPRWLLAGGLAAASLLAHADTGLMVFPHVQVQAQPVAPSAAGQGGFMAYRDPVTGKLTGPDPEQAALLTASARRQMPLLREAPPRPRPMHGGIGLMLEERHARYAVARKDASGRVTETCAPAAAHEGARK